MPSAIVVIASSGDRLPGGQRRRVGRGLLGLHADDPHVGAQRLAPRPRCRRAARRRRCTTTTVRDVRALLEDLQADGALPGDDVGVVERVDEDRAGLVARTPGRATSALVDGVPVRTRPRRRTPRVACTFGSGAPSGMKTVALMPSSCGGERDALRVVAGAGGDDARAPAPRRVSRAIRV